MIKKFEFKQEHGLTSTIKSKGTRNCTYLVSSKGDYCNGWLLHNRLIFIARHNYVLVNPQELNPYFGRQLIQSILAKVGI